MRRFRLSLFLFFLLSPSGILAATQKIPPPRLDALPDRILFLLLLWLIIVALIVILRWKIRLADALFRMMPKEEKK